VHRPGRSGRASWWRRRSRARPRSPAKGSFASRSRRVGSQARGFRRGATGRHPEGPGKPEPPVLSPFSAGRPRVRAGLLRRSASRSAPIRPLSGTNPNRGWSAGRRRSAPFREVDSASLARGSNPPEIRCACTHPGSRPSALPRSPPRRETSRAQGPGPDSRFTRFPPRPLQRGIHPIDPVVEMAFRGKVFQPEARGDNRYLLPSSHGRQRIITGLLRLRAAALSRRSRTSRRGPRPRARAIPASRRRPSARPTPSCRRTSAQAPAPWP